MIKDKKKIYRVKVPSLDACKGNMKENAINQILYIEKENIRSLT